jgi:hypothetical protein
VQRRAGSAPKTRTSSNTLLWRMLGFRREASWQGLACVALMLSTLLLMVIAPAEADDASAAWEEANEEFPIHSFPLKVLRKMLVGTVRYFILLAKASTRHFELSFLELRAIFYLTIVTNDVCQAHSYSPPHV